MGAYVVEGAVRKIWAQVDANDTSGDTLYVGQIVRAESDGVRPFGAATGANLALKVPFGIVTAVSDSDPTWNTTYDGESTSTPANISQALINANKNVGKVGVHPQGDPARYVEIACIGPSTVISMPLYSTTHGTAPTVQTISSASSDGLVTANTSSAADFTTFVADESTIYYRSGLNKGMYRIGINTSATAPQVDLPFPYDETTSDTLVQVPVRMVGPSKVQFDSESTFIDVNATGYGTAYYTIDVLKLDLSVAGQERVEFKFNGDHFCSARA